MNKVNRIYYLKYSDIETTTKYPQINATSTSTSTSIIPNMVVHFKYSGAVYFVGPSLFSKNKMKQNVRLCS